MYNISSISNINTTTTYASLLNYDITNYVNYIYDVLLAQYVPIKNINNQI